MLGPLAGWTLARFGTSFIGGIVMPSLALTHLALTHTASGQGHLSPVLAAAIVGFCVIGELIERALYFQAVHPWRMPGGMAS
jgi:hypothetical protein